MNLIWLLLRASWVNVAIAVLTGLISGGCSARLIALINSAVNEQSTNSLLWYFIGLALVALLTSVVSQVLLISLAQEAVYHLRLRLSRGILSSPLRHLEELGASRLLATLTEDVQTLSNTIFVIPFVCIDLAIIAGCLIYLGWLSGVVFLIVIVFLGIAIASTQLMLTHARKFLSLAREEEDKLFKHFRAITEGIKELKLHALRRQAFLSDELQISAATSRDYNLTAFKTFAIATGWGNLLFFTIVGLLLFVLPQVATVSTPVLSAYILTITYLLVPFQNILERLPALFRANVALQKVERMKLALASQKETNNTTEISTTNWNKLELDQVTHTYRGEYEDSSFVLREINLTLYPGQLVFIVGGNGSGKSTLAKIITGLYIPESGKICLDSKLINEENLEWYRQHFSVIFSDFFLFERLLGIEKDSLDQQAQEYLRKLHLNTKVQVKDGLLSTTALSQGQRKRLALLTVFLEDRPIYLFDEWASDQDPYFRDIFYKELLFNLKQRGKTIIVISHDDRYFHLADRVIKLDYGQVEYDSATSCL
ncbi:cyclic peptide export ABC transporter [Gloeocapsopsis crepidinum LEGE 06123]|uniref:Cyclic peptide export ABC transporter n=1 Tax=Gloeocapsopsis crepidinum LEGE 06123 TaxID=588587 RepID=A0ABR9UQB3_9CHRO|nr:cyclic peptide export ABC transporter [Gloeocapsopsis crepidinum]MBE9190469.1 cyclic peptide export ABC transporter [Gloeocapsopsis crepidinum LEGE 06123]